MPFTNPDRLAQLRAFVDAIYDSAPIGLIPNLTVALFVSLSGPYVFTHLHPTANVIHIRQEYTIQGRSRPDALLAFAQFVNDDISKIDRHDNNVFIAIDIVSPNNTTTWTMKKISSSSQEFSDAVVAGVEAEANISARLLLYMYETIGTITTATHVHAIKTYILHTTIITDVDNGESKKQITVSGAMFESLYCGVFLRKTHVTEYCAFFEAAAPGMTSLPDDPVIYQVRFYVVSGIA